MGSLPDLRNLDPYPIKSYKIGVCTKEFPQHCRNLLKGYGPFVPESKVIRYTRSVGNYTATTLLLTHNDKINNFFNTDDANGYSPISSRSTRSSCTLHHQINNSALLRRNSRQRDSMSSSGGASSVRRLIAVVRSTPSKSGPIYSRRLLFRNFAALCLGHAMITAAFLPLFTLQGSISAWPWQTDFFHFPTHDVGSILLTFLFTVAAISTLGTTFILNKLGTNWTLILSYIVTCLFFGAHLYPNAYTLIPAYVLMGLWLGPLVVARITCLMTLAIKLTYVLTEQEEGEVDGTQGLRKTEVVVHKLFRGFQIAQDFGLIIGNLATSFLIWYSSNLMKNSNDTEITLDSMFFLESSGERICGSNACPLPASYDVSTLPFYSHYLRNSSIPASISCKTSTMLISVFLGFCVMGVAVTAAFMDQIRLHIQRESSSSGGSGGTCSFSFRLILEAFRDPRLQLAAPLSVFIGLEQGFMFSDFTKSYVACALGISYVSLVFLSLGLLQSIAAFTLSLLVQHIRRHVIIAVGFIFQSCLLLVLFLWKPSKEDPALFFVVPAAWGVCNAIWDTLSFSLIVSVYREGWQAPFAQVYFFRYLGLALAFGLHSSLCNWIKLYGLAGAMLLAVAPYTYLEVKHHSKRRLNTKLTSL